MNVLALKAEPEWGYFDHGPADYRAFKAVHLSLLTSPHRTTNPLRAHLFYVPTWDLHGAWGNSELTWRAQRYIASAFPFWNASAGSDHVWTVTRDAGACSTPWGSVWEALANSIILSNWGGVTGLGGRPTERCFDASRDVVIPGVLKKAVVAASPFLPFHAAHPFNHSLAASLAASSPSLWRDRHTLLFFHGAICWETYDKVAYPLLDAKCKRRHGFLDHYSFGVRHKVYSLFRQHPSFVLRATDVLPPPPPAHLSSEMLRSVFCLCPSGTGWGMRVFHAAALGCIPVIVQRDEERAYPPVLQAFEGLLLDWSLFSLQLEQSDLPNLPSILSALANNASAIYAKRQALAATWTRLVWRESLAADAARALRGSPDAFDSLMQTFWLRLQAGNVRRSVPDIAKAVEGVHA
ncbi:MAG: hypothetical protein SGPRY_011540 [Prymnesium sp.]